MKDFITAEEKSILSSLDSTRIVDLKTESNFVLFGVGVGLDLWIIEQSFTPFIMYHQTKASLRSCKMVHYSDQRSSSTDVSRCRFNPDDIINVSDQKYSGFAFGVRNTFSFVLLQTDNWRISSENSFSNINQIYDSNFKAVQYKGLNYDPTYSSSSGLECGGNTYIIYDDASNQNGKPFTGDDLPPKVIYTSRAHGWSTTKLKDLITRQTMKQNPDVIKEKVNDEKPKPKNNKSNEQDSEGLSVRGL